MLTIKYMTNFVALQQNFAALQQQAIFPHLVDISTENRA